VIRAVIRLIVWWCFVCAAAALMLSSRANAHDWYPWNCCSSSDCWPAPDKEPVPKLIGTKYVLFDGTEIDEKDVKPSPDENFHVCRKGGTIQGALIYADGKPCFWAPVSGV